MDPLTFLFWRLHWFFRDPARQAPDGPVIVSPADGVVLYVHRVERGEAPCPVKKGVRLPLEEWVGSVEHAGEGTLIGIYMTPLSVHFNRAPVPGRVTRVVPRPARGPNLSMTRTFMRLLWGMQPYEEGSRYITDNARNTIVIDGPQPAIVVQIADAYVKEIDCFVEEGQDVPCGAKIGMIRMGSQCDLFLPDGAGAQVTCKPGDRVVGGETVLGRYDSR